MSMTLRARAAMLIAAYGIIFSGCFRFGSIRMMAYAMAGMSIFGWGLILGMSMALSGTDQAHVKAWDRGTRLGLRTLNSLLTIGAFLAMMGVYPELAGFIHHWVGYTCEIFFPLVGVTLIAWFYRAMQGLPDGLKTRRLGTAT